MRNPFKKSLSQRISRTARKYVKPHAGKLAGASAGAMFLAIGNWLARKYRGSQDKLPEHPLSWLPRRTRAKSTVVEVGSN